MPNKGGSTQGDESHEAESKVDLGQHVVEGRILKIESVSEHIKKEEGGVMYETTGHQIEGVS